MITQLEEYQRTITIDFCSKYAKVLKLLDLFIHFSVSEFDVRGFGAIIPDAVGVQHNFSVVIIT